MIKKLKESINKMMPGIIFMIIVTLIMLFFSVVQLKYNVYNQNVKEVVIPFLSHDPVKIH